MEGRNLLIALSVKHKGDWQTIYKDIVNRTYLSKEMVEEILKFDYTCLTLLDNEYPERVKKSYRPPFVIYYEGNAEYLKDDMLSVLNENLASDYAFKSLLKVCEDLIEDKTFVIQYGSKKNNEIIKRLIAKGGKVVAVLDRGIRNADDRELYEKLASNHLVLSIYPNQVVSKNTETEIATNSLIATLSTSLLIGGITDKSPTSTAVAFGLSQGADIYCIPFPIGNHYMTNQLIKDGAMLVESGNDILMRKENYEDRREK